MELAGSYSYPGDRRVRRVFWHLDQPRKDFQDLKNEKQFTGRVEYVYGNRNCTLKMNKLTKEDSGEYLLRFLINDNDKFVGKPGVLLSVTGTCPTLNCLSVRCLFTVLN